MRRRSAVIGIAALVAIAGGSVWTLWPHSAKQTATRPAPVPVTQDTADSQDVPIYIQALGTVQALNTVNVRSRVDGQIVKVPIKEGQEVKTGDPLLEIDPRPFQAALTQAQANKAKDEAQLQGAQLDLDRYTKLLPSGYQTRQSYDQQKAMVGQLQGSVQADQAQIEAAQLNLGYATIRSPIDGRTGQRLVDIGNFVQASQNANLLIITQLKPIFVSFTAPQGSLDEIRRNQQEAPLTVEAYAADQETLLSTGKLTLIDNQVDTATGTIHLKATFDNADERLWPGEFVNVRLIVTTRHDAVTVPAQTVMQGPGGSYVYVIQPDDTVHRQTVDVSLTQDGRAVIDSGVSAGQHVVVEGQYRLTEGSKVNAAAPEQATLEEQPHR